MQALHDAILDALLNGGVLPEETIERLLGDPADADQSDARSKLEELIQQIIERLARAGLHHRCRPISKASAQRRRAGGRGRPDQAAGHFEVTDKALDFLGYRALRDLLGSLGKSSFGRHDTRELATGVETTGAPKPYEFGDTLNLDAGGDAAQRRRSARRATRTRTLRTGARPAPAAHASRHRSHRRHPRRPDGRAGRISELLRDGADARLQPQHDPVRRGSIHAGQAGGAGARAADPDAVSRATR